MNARLASAKLIRPTGTTTPTMAKVIPLDTARTRGSDTAASGYWRLRAVLVAQRLEVLDLTVPAQLASDHAEEIAERPAEAQRRAPWIRSLEQVATSAEAARRAETPFARRIRRQRRALQLVQIACWGLAGVLLTACIAVKVLT